MNISLKPLAAVALAAAGTLALGAAVPSSAGYLDDESATSTVVTAPPGAYTPTDLNRAALTGAGLAGGAVYVWGAKGGGIAGNGKWNVPADGPSDGSVVRVDLPITSDPKTTRPATITQLALNSATFETDEYKAGTTGAALSDTGDVYTWGSNFGGKLGSGNPDTTAVCTRGLAANCAPGPILSGVKKITASNNAFYALKSNGELWGWGTSLFATSNGQWATGELGKTGLDKPITFTTPTLLKTGIADTFGTSSGRFDLTTANLLYFSGIQTTTMGATPSGSYLFDPITDFAVPSVMAVVGGDTVKDIQANATNGLLLTGTGKLISWGGSNALLGRPKCGCAFENPALIKFKVNSTTVSTSPVKDIAAGEQHGLAVLGDGSVWGWGPEWAAVGNTAYRGGFFSEPVLVNNPLNPVNDGMQLGNDNLAVSVMPYSAFVTKADYSVLGWGMGGATGSILPGATMKLNSTLGKYIAPITKLTFPGVR